MAKNKKFNEDFLEKIAALESAGGTMTNHKPANKGSIHEGTTAMGTYALMPLTVASLVQQHPENQEFNDLKNLVDFENTSNPNVKESKLQALKNYIKENPQVEASLAKSLKDQIEQNVGGDEGLGAVAWLAGSSATPKKLNTILKSPGPVGVEARQRLQNWNSLSKQGSLPSSVPTMKQDTIYSNTPSMLNKMYARPTIESDEITNQMEDKPEESPWDALKKYLLGQNE